MRTMLHKARHLQIKIETTALFVIWMALGQSSVALAAVERGTLLSLHNQARQAAGLSELTISDQLAAAAQNKANDMLADQYFAHTSPDGVTPWSWIRGAGYVYDSAGENLAIDFFSSTAVFDAWMNSSGHRANILSGTYAEVGFGIAQGEFEGRQTTLVAVMFGHRTGATVPAYTPTQPSTTPAYTPSYTPPPDTTAPAAPSILTPAFDDLLSSSTCLISGEAEANCTIRIYSGETQLGETTTDGDGRFAAEITIPDGAHEIAATATDAAGNVSEASTVRFTIDTTAPAAPVVLTPVAGAILNTATSRVTGTAEAGSQVIVYRGDQMIGQTFADETGNFFIDTETLDGVHQLTATATDRAGNASIHTSPVTFSVDTLPPQIAVESAVRVSADVMADRSFMARVQLNEPVEGLQGVAHIGDADFIMQPNVATGTFDLTASATTTDASLNMQPSQTSESSEMAIGFTLTDAAGNTIDISPVTISVLENYAATVKQLPLEQLFWESVTDQENKPVQVSAYAAALLGLVEIGFAISRIKPMPALSRKYHALAHYAMAGITAILFIKH